jgi:ring-1,2-phenylacetyl-CoA epoxidase subunit PaaD
MEPNAATRLQQADLLALLHQVKDPEIPAVSLVDLGVITEARINPDGSVFVEMVPTFAGCPALQLMRLELEEVLRQAQVPAFTVQVNHNKPWSSNRVTETGRRQLLEFGLSPPPKHYNGDLEPELLQGALCPKCGSTNTELKNPFGPTQCRAIHHCHNCLETFEQFKPV